MEWFSVSPDDGERTELSGEMSLSSHRQHGDGTVSLSSHLSLRHRSFPPGTILTCIVSHPAQGAPVSTSLVVLPPASGKGKHLVDAVSLFGLFFHWQVLISITLDKIIWNVRFHALGTPLFKMEWTYFTQVSELPTIFIWSNKMTPKHTCRIRIMRHWQSPSADCAKNGTKRT